MTHLSQIIAVEKDIKAKAESSRSTAEGKFGKSNLYSGLSRTYAANNDDDDERLPPESTQVQMKVKSIVAEVHSSLIRLFDTVATKDYANCSAVADIVVDGHSLLTDVPATYILFLEKQVAELLSFVKKIPTLDTSEIWKHDPNKDIYVTEPVETIRTKKVVRPLVAHQGTKEHPPQVHLVNEDIPVGRWTTIKFSGALPAKEINNLVERIEKLQHAVKFAREEANRHEAVQRHPGETLLSYVFG